MEIWWVFLFVDCFLIFFMVFERLYFWLKFVIISGYYVVFIVGGYNFVLIERLVFYVVDRVYWMFFVKCIMSLGIVFNYIKFEFVC